jgi:GT2 family glycosyltransferase
VAVVAGGIEEATRVEQSADSPGIFSKWTATPTRGFAATSEGEADHAGGGNFSVWRSVVEGLGGIDESFQVGAALYEETDFCLRVKLAGYRIYFNGKARLTHLGAATGGCRVRDVGNYVYGLAHNRAILTRRHLRWYQVPSALARLVVLGGSYAVHYHEPRALWACATGCIAGLRRGNRLPLCTRYREALP